MKIDSNRGYIFNKYEIIYILKAIGLYKLFDESLSTSLSAKEIIFKAEKGLREKNYVYEDFYGKFSS